MTTTLPIDIEAFRTLSKHANSWPIVKKKKSILMQTYSCVDFSPYNNRNYIFFFSLITREIICLHLLIQKHVVSWSFWMKFGSSSYYRRQRQNTTIMLPRPSWVLWVMHAWAIMSLLDSRLT